MKMADRQQRKSYGMLRMSRAIRRAIGAANAHEQDRAMRWVAAWGLIGGIRSDTVRLRNPELLQPEPAQLAQASR
jgi:hypothetical protein